MVIFTPVTPLPNRVEPSVSTPYEALDQHMDSMTSQLDKIMIMFCQLAATPNAPTLGLPPKPDDESTVYGSTVHTITSPPGPTTQQPILEPTPPVQGPPPPVAASNAELIGDNLVCLLYTPQGHHHRHTTVPSAI
jgi:hypothetical protein